MLVLLILNLRRRTFPPQNWYDAINVPIRNMSLKIKKFTLLLREKFSASYVGSWLNAINFKINRIHHLNFAKIYSFLMAQGAQSYHFVGPSQSSYVIHTLHVYNFYNMKLFTHLSF